MAYLAGLLVNIAIFVPPAFNKAPVQKSPVQKKLASCRRVTDSLDVVTVGIEHERAVIVGMIMRADAGRAIVAPACRDGGLVERVDRGAVLREDRDMQRLVHARFTAHPEIWPAAPAATRRPNTAGLLPRSFPYP